MASIKGWNKTSLVDYPPNIVSVVFLKGCNFRCGYCHNPDIVLNYESLNDIDEKEIISYLTEQKKWIDGVCITGGEPCLHKDLVKFVFDIKKTGMLVKIDTNGSNPSMIKELLGKKLVDMIAMDIKAPLKKYELVASAKIDKKSILESIDLIRNSGIDYEFRTTVVPGLVDANDIAEIGKWLKGSKRFAIQNFRGKVNLIDNELKNMKGYSK